MKLTLCVLLLAFLSPSLLAQTQSALLTSAGCGPLTTNFDVKTQASNHTFSPPDSGKALVYVFEHEDQVRGTQLINATIRIGVDGQWVGAERGASYFAFPVEPGTHSVCVNWQSSVAKFSKLFAATTVNAAAGNIYYLQVWVEEPSNGRSLSLAPVDPAEAKVLIATTGLSQPREKTK